MSAPVGVWNTRRSNSGITVVDEALEFMGLYDFHGLAKAQMVLGDASGASAIVERHTVTKRDPGTDFEIGTNFRTSTTPKNEIACWRYKLCNKNLGKGKPVSIESVRGLLEDSMQKGSVISWYTNVFDLKAATIHLFRRGDFSRVVVIDLRSELENGKREIDMAELVESAAEPYLQNDRRSAADLRDAELLQSGD